MPKRIWIPLVIVGILAIVGIGFLAPSSRQTDPENTAAISATLTATFPEFNGHAFSIPYENRGEYTMGGHSVNVSTDVVFPISDYPALVTWLNEREAEQRYQCSLEEFPVTSAQRTQDTSPEALCEWRPDSGLIEVPGSTTGELIQAPDYMATEGTFQAGGQEYFYRVEKKKNSTDSMIMTITDSYFVSN